MEVSNFRCGECKYHGMNCKCIDHTKVHFARSCFSCDEMTSHHMICSAFAPVDYYPMVKKEWEELGGFENWHKLFIEQWHNGKEPLGINLILTKAKEDGREVFDDIWTVPYRDFVNLNIMRKDGIHYTDYMHIERSRKSPTGYKWIHESEGILKYEELEGN